MITSGPRVVALLILVVVTTAGCRATAGAEPASQAVDVAVPSYAAVPDAPGYCALLAGSRHLTGVPSAVGLLAGERGNVAAELALSAAIQELRTARQAVRELGGSPALEAALDDLVAALADARDTVVTAPIREAVSAALDDVGRLAQPACEFPS